MSVERNDTVILELDRPRELRLGHKALKRFSALTGCAMTEMEQAMQSYDKMTALLYVMLSQEDPSLTPEAADDLLDAVPVCRLLEAAARAVQASFEAPEAEEITGGPPMTGTGGGA